MKTALITGASRGIGKAIAIKLSQEGYNVIINYNNSKDEAITLSNSLQNAIAIKADISKSDEVIAMVCAAKKQFGGIDILINNAGIAEQKLFFDITESDFDRMYEINLKGMFHTCKAILPQMVQNRYGKIINISSIWGICGASCEVHYSTMKAGIIGFTKALAKEVGPSKVTVNCVAPGVIMTDMNQALSEQTLQELKEETPLMELGTPQDIANVVCFLASDDANFITGQVISPNGGMII
ncbi:MAG: 3-oxoacyl-ACP reductase FabG [Oscillospiraceae bacterium]